MISTEGDRGFAVEDVDTLRRRKETKGDFHWKGRVCAEEFAGDTTPGNTNGCHVPGMDSPMQKLVLHGLWG